MQIWPAIDILNGKCVRLVQGDYSRERVYADDPSDEAGRWIAQGASGLHIVDLNAARDGSAANFDVIVSLARQFDVPVQVGGGIRDEQRISSYLENGVKRLVVGTRAVKDPEWTTQMALRYPGTILVGIDARNGKVATDGWLETSDFEATELAARMAAHEFAGIIYTDISRDGMLEGPNLDAMAQMRNAVSLPVIASGGVTTVDDVVALAEKQLAGCIVGRALYEGRLTVKEAIEAAGGVALPAITESTDQTPGERSGTNQTNNQH
ncbi:MAG: 1-(5-phosphoribosyl)-5-[(5-phosphoribosylamino)methylideneamino]imidazole-4-carboxamide isomerase [Planctomycetota bacterium]